MCTWLKSQVESGEPSLFTILLTLGGDLGVVNARSTGLLLQRYGLAGIYNCHDKYPISAGLGSYAGIP